MDTAFFVGVIVGMIATNVWGVAIAPAFTRFHFRRAVFPNPPRLERYAEEADPPRLGRYAEEADPPRLGRRVKKADDLSPLGRDGVRRSKKGSKRPA